MTYVLSIAKLRVGQEAYQLSGVAQSLDAYYTGSGEAHGQWVGGSADRLGLAGQVSADDLRAVLAGLRPGTGGLTPNGDTVRTHPRRVPGFDLTFKIPKSASVLYAVADDPRVQGAVIEAGEAAVRAAVGWLEREAIQVQRGSHNLAYLARRPEHERAHAGPRREGTHGVVAAAFRHRTSRAGDPLLHWHVLVANLVEGVDGRWSSFAHPELYRNVRAAGEVFQSAFRAELTQSLGVEWKHGRHVMEIAGVPERVVELFSKRSTEIEDWLDATGTPDTPEGRQQAVLATRRHKPELEHGSSRFDAEWKAEAEAAGWGPERAAELIAACSPDRAPVAYDDAWRLRTVGVDENGNVDEHERTVDPDDWVADLLRRDLTAERTTFTHADLTRAVAARQGPGATTETIERITQRVLASQHTTPVAAADGGPTRWTSREVLAIEQRFLAALTVPMPVAVAPVAVEQAIAARTLGADQQGVTRRLCFSEMAVSVLVGPAGTGKTYTLDAIAHAHQLAGVQVVGAAPSARAALELNSATGVPAATLHALLGRWERGHDAPLPGSLLVIDEAGMADIRTLTAAVARQVEAGGRVLLAGDHRQLPEVGAGGGFAYATRRAGCVAELTVNRRQHDAWERTALAELRDGRVAAAVAAYLRNERVTVTADHRAATAAAIELWATARAQGRNPILLAGTNDLVDRLNQAAIDHLTSTGELAAVEPVMYGDTPVRPGERVVLRRNSLLDHRASGAVSADERAAQQQALVANGQAGTILTATRENVTVQLDDGPTVTVDQRYLNRGGHITHAYALTTHRSQGGTWDQAIAVGADALYREAAYVQLSRGAQDNHIVLTDPEAAAIINELRTDTERHDTGLALPDEHPEGLDQHLTERLSRSAAKHLAHALDPEIDIVRASATSTALPVLEALYRDARWAEQVAVHIHGTTRTTLSERHQRLDHIARHINIGHEVSPADRNNVGTVLALQDTAGTATVHFVSQDGREATKTFPWSDLRIVAPSQPAERELPPAAARCLGEALGVVDRAIECWDATLAEHGIDPGDTRIFRAAIDQQLSQRAASLAAEQPTWLTHIVGRRPADPIGADVWDDAVRTVARYQLTAGHQPPDISFNDWNVLAASLDQTRAWLATTDRITETAAVVRTPAERANRVLQLEVILASAPTDCRHFINELQSGQLAIGHTEELLQAALIQQDERKTWIVEHWPHIVEYHELTAVPGTPLAPAADRDEPTITLEF